jgi:hypothetical protein
MIPDHARASSGSRQFGFVMAKRLNDIESN